MTTNMTEYFAFAYSEQSFVSYVETLKTVSHDVMCSGQVEGGPTLAP